MDKTKFLQTIGTISAIILSMLTISVTNYVKAIDPVYDFTSLTWELYHMLTFGLLLFTTFVMQITGGSYFKQRLKHSGLNYFLYFSLFITHTIIAPLAIIIAVMKIELGQFWWVVLAGVLGLIFWLAIRTEDAIT